MFKIPAKITTVDYIGVSTAESDKLRNFIFSQLEILQGQMKYNDLKQGKRTVTTGDNIKVEVSIMFGVAQAVAVIGADSSISIDEYACFCSTYGLMAGRIIHLHDEVDNETDIMEHYVDDESYAADILVCQKSGLGIPKLIDIREVRESAGKRISKLQSRHKESFWISTTFNNIPFTDRYTHNYGDLVLILAMPLVDYRPTNQQAHTYGMSYTEKFGAWSPEINRRRIANYTIENPNAQLTNRYISSTGLTHLLTSDYKIWDESKGGELKFTPFRILPILLDSCFSGYQP